MEVSSWENHLFLWAMASMAMLNNQRVYIYIYISLAEFYDPNLNSGNLQKRGLRNNIGRPREIGYSLSHMLKKLQNVPSGYLT